jgi:pyruvate,water dikinase
VILDPVGARLEPGEVLVAPSTDPGWTPLFLAAGGLVMEIGGATSHGALVAPEYGPPRSVVPPPHPHRDKSPGTGLTGPDSRPDRRAHQRLPVRTRR